MLEAMLPLSGFDICMLGCFFFLHSNSGQQQIWQLLLNFQIIRFFSSVYADDTLNQMDKHPPPLSLSFRLFLTLFLSPTLSGLLSWEPAPRSGPEAHQLLPEDGDRPGLPLQPRGLHAQNACKALCAQKHKFHSLSSDPTATV